MEQMGTPSQQWDEVKWRRFYLEMVNFTRQPNEDPEDIVAGGWNLGHFRSQVNRREFMIWDDVPFCLSLFCFYPLKPPIKEEGYEWLLENRYRYFEGASSSERYFRLINAVPEQILRLDLNQLFGLLQIVPVQQIIRSEEAASG